MQRDELGRRGTSNRSPRQVWVRVGVGLVIPLVAAGRGGDPMLRLNLPGGEVQLSDDAGWSFSIDLEGSHGS